MPSTILVVDDDPQVRKLCRTALEAFGYSVKEAGDGKAALATVKQKMVDLILLDLCMPDMDGIEILKALRTELPQLKVITMSGFMGGVMLPAARHLGGAASIAKPFSPDSLVSLVDEVLAKAGPAKASD
jgi:CheY-like chemotaxis protein